VMRSEDKYRLLAKEREAAALRGARSGGSRARSARRGQPPFSLAQGRPALRRSRTPLGGTGSPDAHGDQSVTFTRTITFELRDINTSELRCVFQARSEDGLKRTRQQLDPCHRLALGMVALTGFTFPVVTI
jgi:hypothetical protein